MKIKTLKQLLFRLKVAITATLLISPFWAIGQDQTSVDLKYMYGYDADDGYYYPTKDEIKPIDLYPISNEFAVR